MFSGPGGKRLWSSYVRAWLGRMANKIGVDRLHAHGARHGHALYLAGRGVPLHMIRDDLGHSNISTTDRYIARLNPTERVNAIINAYR